MWKEKKKLLQGGEKGVGETEIMLMEARERKEKVSGLFVGLVSNIVECKFEDNRKYTQCD